MDVESDAALARELQKQVAMTTSQSWIQLHTPCSIHCHGIMVCMMLLPVRRLIHAPSVYPPPPSGTRQTWRHRLCFQRWHCQTRADCAPHQFLQRLWSFFGWACFSCFLFIPPAVFSVFFLCFSLLPRSFAWIEFVFSSSNREYVAHLIRSHADSCTQCLGYMLCTPSLELTFQLICMLCQCSFWRQMWR